MKKYFIVGVALLSVGCGHMQTAPQCPEPVSSVSPSPSPSPVAVIFPTAVWHQPANSLSKWASRGINTVFGPELGNPPRALSEYTAEANRLGLRMFMTMAAPDPLPGVVGFNQPDEPELLNHQTPTEIFKGNYEGWKAKAPALPVFCSFSGSDVTNNQTKIASFYSRWAPYCDIVSEDWYLTNRNADRYFLANHKATAIKALTAAYPDKQVWSIVEASDQKLNCPAEQNVGGAPRVGRQPTALEFRAEIWSAVIHGAKGIAYFPQEIGTRCAQWADGSTKDNPRFGSFKYDAMTDDLVAEMTRQNINLQSLAPILLSAGKLLPLPAPVIGASRSYGGQDYRLLLNYSPTETMFEGARLAPYEVRVEPVSKVIP
jgi:hypothetical protein